MAGRLGSPPPWMTDRLNHPSEQNCHMQAIRSTLEHRVLFPEQSARERHPALIMLHGRGADEEDLVGLVPVFDRSLLVLSVRAPHRFSFGGYTWYEVGEAGRPEPELFQDSYDRLMQFVGDALAAYPIDTGRVYLLGFSMGTVMGYAISLTHTELFRGMIAHSGYVPEGTNLVLRWNELAGRSFFIAHGVADDVIPVSLARRARHLFESSTASTFYKEYPIGHEISQESLQDAAKFLNRLTSKFPEP
jgi:phospholipase/carboxylesterase